MNATYKRLDGGCGTAAAIEIITLRTIAKQQSRGKTVSLNGLYASARVPLSIAMMHISDLVISKIPTKDNNPYFHYWHAPNAHDSGWTFKDEDVFLDHDKGLRLLELHDGLASNESLEDWGPHLGCPAMLIKGYINKAHRIATDASIEAGLIFPS